jgi:hypothetical protein
MRNDSILAEIHRVTSQTRQRLASSNFPRLAQLKVRLSPGGQYMLMNIILLCWHDQRDYAKYIQEHIAEYEQDLEAQHESEIHRLRERLVQYLSA